MHTNILPLDVNLKEQTQHGSLQFPIQYYVDELYRFQDRRIPLHWHPELEFYVVHGGTTQIQIANITIVLEPGCGIFLNANVLHSFHQVLESEKCQCPNIVFSDKLIAPVSSIIYQTYVEPLIMDTSLPFVVLRPQNTWQKDILIHLDLIFSLLQKYAPHGAYGTSPNLQYEHSNRTSPCFEMEVQCTLNQIWQIFYCHQKEMPRTPVTKTKHHLQVRMQKMLGYIYANYPYPVLLENIAEAANISKSEASRCFHSCLHTSPMNYLLRYRIEKAKELLPNPAKTVHEVSLSCGFQSTSYFCKVFREQTGMTAVQYKEKFPASVS